MDIAVIIVSIICAILLIWLLIEARRITADMRRQSGTEQSILMLQQQIGQLREALDQRMEAVRRQLTDTGRSIDERLSSSVQVFGEVKKELGSLGRASEQILHVGRDISSLQELLRSPKLRGGFGETFLQQLLQQILPREYCAEQHRFRSGEIVDAVIKIGGKLLPVDAKFPLENFRQMTNAPDEDRQQSFRKVFVADVRKHVQSIADKYILPAEGTFDFAFMYIPAEKIYYELIAGNEAYAALTELARNRKVFLVSPSTLYAHLQIILLGLKGMHIEQEAQLILSRLSQMKGDISRFADEFSVMGKHLGNVKTKYDDADRKLQRLQERIHDIEEA